jgi:hypothetical protein
MLGGSFSITSSKVIVSVSVAALLGVSVAAHAIVDLQTHPLQQLQQLQLMFVYGVSDCGLVVRVLGYRSRGPASIPGAIRFYKK